MKRSRRPGRAALASFISSSSPSSSLGLTSLSPSVSLLAPSQHFKPFEERHLVVQKKPQSTSGHALSIVSNFTSYHHHYAFSSPRTSNKPTLIKSNHQLQQLLVWFAHHLLSATDVFPKGWGFFFPIFPLWGILKLCVGVIGGVGIENNYRWGASFYDHFGMCGI